MIGLNDKKLTDKEFIGYFRDLLEFLIRKTFDSKDELLFVTYQPKNQTLDPIEVRKYTNQLLNKFKYVEVIEQTYKTSNRFNDGNYTDGHHSHIIIKESDYYIIKTQLNGIDIVDKVIYDLEGLTDRYLIKQAYKRLLPKNHIPIISKKGILADETTTQIYILTFVKKLISKYSKVFQSVSINQILPKYFIEINKINTFYKFVNDT